MKNTFIFPLLCAAAMMAGCSGETTDNAQLEADISPVLPKISSTVTQVRVADNQNVKKGDTLVVLDEETFKLAVEQAQIALKQAEISVALAKNNKSSANVSVSNVTASSDAIFANLSAADAAIESAREQVSVADKNFERYQNLLQQKSATQQQFDQVKAARIDAQSRLKSVEGQRNALLKQIDASKLQIQNTRNQVSNTSENITLADLAVAQGRTALKSAQLQLSYCTILAPVDGIVSRKNIQIGQVVAPGQPLMAIADNKKVWIVANFKETQLQKIHPGQNAEIEVEAFSDEKFTGKVESIAQATGAKFSFLPSDNATGNFVKVTQRIPVKITLDEASQKKAALRAGMSVNVTVKTDE
jgi:membrane fusion protein (multidrug efflux system)